MLLVFWLVVGRIGNLLGKVMYLVSVIVGDGIGKLVGGDVL